MSKNLWYGKTHHLQSPSDKSIIHSVEYGLTCERIRNTCVAQLPLTREDYSLGNIEGERSNIDNFKVIVK